MRSITGKTIAFRPAGDPPGFWAYVLGDEILADIGWSSYERAIRIEAAGEVWRIHFAGWRAVRCVLEGPDHGARLRYYGGLKAGVAEVPGGRRFELFSRLDLQHGSWMGIDDEEREGVVRISGRFGRGGVWHEVRIAPESRHADLVWPLLYLWGGLRIFERRNPIARMMGFLRGVDRAASRLLAPTEKGPSEGYIS